jgi:hypothetical protein
MRLLIRVVPFFIVVLVCSDAYAVSYVVPRDEALVGKATAVVIGRAVHSLAEESHERGIETITLFAVEDVLNGDASLEDTVRVHEPGGVVETKKGVRKFKVVPGVPHFFDGERVLLFVNKIDGGDFATTDFGLGLFRFATDDLGHRVVVRDETEIFGWDPDGSAHHEARRDEDRFIRFIRDIANHRPASNDYTIKANPITHENPAPSSPGARRPIRALSMFTVTQYTLPLYVVNQPPCNVGSMAQQIACVEAAPGPRWNTFPSAVNWNRGNTETNAGNGGSDAINTAFTSWNGDVNSNVNYVLATTISNTNGVLEMPDGVNNIVFEKDIGVPAFSCGGGGVLGIGGIQNTSGTSVVNGETFDNTTEADVSMNQGVGACLPSGTGTFPTGDFYSAVTHEVGHTLGFRHADKTRENSQPCSTPGTYDCETTTAIMKAFITLGLNGGLQAWDHRAVAALYPSGPPPPAPTNVLATATTSTSVGLTWTASTGATSYNVLRTANNSTYSTVGTPATNSFTDSTASANTAYLYKVTANGPGGTSADSNKDLATTVIFTDPTLTVQSTQIQALHFTELRTAVTAVCALAGNPAPCSTSFTDPTLTAQMTAVKGAHLTELRSKLDASRVVLGQSALTYTDSTIMLQSTLIQAVHITEVRNGVK